MKEERAVIRSLSAESPPGAEMHRRLSVHYENSAALQRSVYEWSVQKWLHSVKLEEGARRLSKSITDENIKRVHDMILQNRQMKWRINRKLVTLQPVKLSTTNLPFIKSDHDSFRSDSQNHTNRNVRISAKVFLISVVKKVTSCLAESSWGWKMDPTLRSGM